MTWQILTGDFVSETGVTSAYLAGIVDADGTIGIKRNRSAWAPTYSERICVKQVEPQAVDLLHERYGGYRFTAKPSARNGRVLQGWQVTDRQAALALGDLRPFLRIKGRQADNCLALREVKERSKRLRVAFGRGHAGSAHRAEDITAEMEALYEQAHLLNRVGGDAK